MISGFYFSLSPEKDSVILGRSNEFIYGGVNITWFANKKI